VKVGVLALQGDVREHAAALAELGADVVEVRTPEQLAGVTALVMPGGESTTMSLLLESNGLYDAIAARLRDGMPAFGTCAGMILLAREVLDGRPDQRFFGAIDISVRRNAFGRQRDSFETTLAVSGVVGDPVDAVFIRAPFVERAGPNVELLAEVDGHPVLCREGPVLVAAFHPELSARSEGRLGRRPADLRIHELFLGDL
jgi:5'-phosphate synthase pdxT subunit